MPELPEVETVRRSLLPYLPGRRIETVAIRAPRLVITPSLEEMQQRLPGRVFGQPDRKGKLLILPLGEETLLVHLGMTGQLTVRDPNRADQAFDRHPTTGLQRSFQHPVDAHTHVDLLLSGEPSIWMHYRDIRKFGKWRLFRSDDPALHAFVEALGPDPLTEHFDLERFVARVRGSDRAVKASLLDQTVLAGVGNIYADEALFLAGIRPDRRGTRLSRLRAARLFEAVREVLRKGIENGGTSFSDYVDAHGNKGTNQETLRVYGRYGKPCLTCGTVLRRSEVAGRTSTWCPVCQK